MKCLVTGATGFIGRHLMAQLFSLGLAADIDCLVDPKLKAREQLALATYVSAGVKAMEGDLTTGQVNGPPPARVDVVFHLAANIDTAATGAELAVNDLGTEHLLDWLGAGARGARIVHASSVAVHDRRGTSHGSPITETSPFSPRTEYGRSKLRAERILQDEAATRGYTYTILRLATVYGRDPKPGGLFDTFAQYAATGHLAGRLDWPGRTSIINADDAAAVMLWIAHRPEAANQVYCVANPEAPTVGELAREIGRAMGHRVTPIRAPAWMWRLTRGVVCNPLVFALTPRMARRSLWRLSLIVDDGFWVDPSKLQTIWKRPPTALPDGLAAMFDPATRP